jgi:hypothetical protein
MKHQEMRDQAFRAGIHMGVRIMLTLLAGEPLRTEDRDGNPYEFFFDKAAGQWVGKGNGQVKVYAGMRDAIMAFATGSGID